ncbi:nucleotidyl transferase AbiEii/AbiGii toxin family protein [Patescibacteria group bacterium]|nr:nucleotidyl transferase AbiEii/AbiGii toxin family protein [Patescibacteria group bacterium]
MHLEILASEQKKIFPFLSVLKKDFYLAGGTAIALWLGHRKSIDFDFFSPDPINSQKIETLFIRSGHKATQTLLSTIDEYTFITDGVKFSFISYPFPIVADENCEKVLRLPNLLALAAMKAYTLGRRAKWKDYVDLYFLTKDHFSINVISNEADRIFGGSFNERAFREQLAYFEGIDCSEKVELTKDNSVKDSEIQKFLVNISTK